MRRRMVVWGWLMVLFLAVATQPGPAAAELVMADTAGADTFTTTDYYGVRNLSAGSFIRSITFDITADADAFFDFDGSTSFNNAVAPVVGALVGLDAGDISFGFGNFIGGNPAHPAVIEVFFAPGSFGPGDSLRFSADTDFFVSDPAPGGVFGAGGAVFSAVLESGQSGSVAFIKLINDASVAPLDIYTKSDSVPEPATLLFLACGLIGLVGSGRRLRT